MSGKLFDDTNPPSRLVTDDGFAPATPLADRMRPRSLDEVEGPETVVGESVAFEAFGDEVVFEVAAVRARGRLAVRRALRRLSSSRRASGRHSAGGHRARTLPRASPQLQPLRR